MVYENEAIESDFYGLCRLVYVCGMVRKRQKIRPSPRIFVFRTFDQLSVDLTLE